LERKRHGARGEKPVGNGKGPARRNQPRGKNEINKALLALLGGGRYQQESSAIVYQGKGNPGQRKSLRKGLEGQKKYEH